MMGMIMDNTQPEVGRTQDTTMAILSHVGGLFMFWIVALANLVCSIVAAVKASNGITYRYPLTMRLVK